MPKLPTPRPTYRAPLRVWLAATAALLAGCASTQNGMDADRGQGHTAAPAVPGQVATAPGQVVTAKAYAETDVMGSPRQLVFDGNRNGKAVFSADGQSVIFESERDAKNPFFQLFRMDLDTGDTERLSTGHGSARAPAPIKGGALVYASTHHADSAAAAMQAELDFRAAGKRRRYDVDFDVAYDLFGRGPDGVLAQLTSAPGYDHAPSVSPDGTAVVYASHRATPIGADWAAHDPSHVEIYVKSLLADGGAPVRLTSNSAVDGAPVWTPDGKRIVWQQFSADGHGAELWIMDADGQNKRQLTHQNAMALAPAVHPSGAYAVYSSSKLGFHNFELYAVALDGGAPVRVTLTKGYDGSPAFAPDGKRLLWSSTRSQKGKKAIHLATWNHEAALALLARGQGGPVYTQTATAKPLDTAQFTPGYTAADIARHVQALTSDAMDGRLTGTPGEALATQYVADFFASQALAPAGTDDTYFQPFAFTSGVSLAGANVLSVMQGDQKVRPALGEDWTPLAFSKPGSVGFADVAFAGYGIVAPAGEGQPAYDSYGDVDVKGKWVLVLRDVPQNVPAERRQHLARFAPLRFKAMEARDRGAKGLLVVTGPSTIVKNELVPLRFDASVSGTSITAVSVTRNVVKTWFDGAKTSLKAAQAALDDGKALSGFDLPGQQVGGHLTLKFTESVGRNVIARLQVGEKPSAQVVVVGAHVDHLGHGNGGDSLARADEKGKIHPGADDNASGVAGLLEIAAHLSDMKAKGKLKGARRDVVFIAWSGEELGLLGSNHYVKERVKTDADKDQMLTGAIAAYLNMDMIGRLREHVVLGGAGSSPDWSGEVERRNAPVGLPVKLSADPYLPTDATSFYLRGVPVLSAFTGVHGEYHSPRDTADTLNMDGAAKTAKLMGLITRAMAMREKAPAYVKMAPPQKRANRRVGRAYLGTIPDYAENAVMGVQLSGVAAGGPAEAAGLKAGDVITKLAGRDLENIYDYVKALDALKIGQEVPLTVKRGTETIELKVTPTSRD